MSPSPNTDFAKAGSRSLPRVEPGEVGLSASRLDRLTARMRQGVETGEIPGAVVLIARRGKVAYEESFGLRDPAAGAAMRPDAIFRIASMTKPITSMAAMMLAEEGRIGLADPVKNYIPEFGDLKVLREGATGGGESPDELAPLRRDMTVQDLLRHTSGLTYGFTGVHPLKKRYVADKVSDPANTNAEHVRRLAQLPLMFQPGSHWEYGVSTDVLGRVIEVASGQGLDRFVAERITGPLQLPDTAFFAPEGTRDRAAYPQPEGPDKRMPHVPDPMTEWAFKSGGGGMVSTAQDYARLCQCWLNGGQLDGVRLVSRTTMALMTSNHLPPGTRFDREMEYFGSSLPSPDIGNGFGLGFAVRTAPGLNPLPGSEGLYAWSGIYGTSFWVDPKEDLFGILMLQSVEMRSIYRILMRALVYQAVED